MVGHDELKSYFENARRWEQDLLLSAHRSRRTAWVIAAAACALAVASVGAVAALAPLKTVEPFVIRVDNATGIVDTVSALNSTPARYDEAVTKYFAMFAHARVTAIRRPKPISARFRSFQARANRHASPRGTAAPTPKARKSFRAASASRRCVSRRFRFLPIMSRLCGS